MRASLCAAVRARRVYGLHSWYDDTLCWNSPVFDDTGGYPCWMEICYRKCEDREKSGGYKIQVYGCDDNCTNPIKQQCVRCD